MSKTWQLLRKEHRRLRFWWCLWWVLVLTDAVLRYTQAAYVGDHGLDQSMCLYEQAFPWLAMGLSLLIIGLCYLEEAPVAKASFGQALPLSPSRLFLVKISLLLGHFLVMPAVIEWVVCLGEGFGKYALWLVLDWIVDRLLILCACIAIAAISGNMGVYVALLVLVKVLLLLGVPRVYSDGENFFAGGFVVGGATVFLAIAYHLVRV